MFLSVLGRRKKFLCVIILPSWSRCYKSNWQDLPFLLAHCLSPPLLTFHFSYTVWRPIAPSLPTLPQHHPAAFTLADAGQVLIRWRTCALSRKNIKPLQCLKLPPTLLYFSTWRCFQLQRKQKPLSKNSQNFPLPYQKIHLDPHPLVLFSLMWSSDLLPNLRHNPSIPTPVFCIFYFPSLVPHFISARY